MLRTGHLRTTLADPGFRRLYATRLAGQFGDGVFQASLAGVVLFNPQRQAHAADIAAGFAVLLLPYSLIGPFAGVLLDRWSRQRVLVAANVARALAVLAVAAEMRGGLHGMPFYATALMVISLSRFVLAALSAALPHVVGTANLVTANAFSTTSGAVATTIGGAAAIGVRVATGGSSADYARIAVAALVPYLVAAAIARGFVRAALGPDEVERGHRQSFADVARGLAAGARHVYRRKPVFHALVAIGVQRLCYGFWAVSILLLYRNYFTDDGLFRSGLAGLAQVVVAVAIGGGLAALITPAASRHLGLVRWPALLLMLAAAAEVGLSLPYLLPLTLLAAGVLALVAQSLQICVDTLVQQQIEDEFRGRVFSLYDMLYNLMLVMAAVIIATLLPESGHSPAFVIVVGCIYAATAVAWLRVGAAAATMARPVTALSDGTA